MERVAEQEPASVGIPVTTTGICRMKDMMRGICGKELAATIIDVLVRGECTFGLTLFHRRHAASLFKYEERVDGLQDVL